MSDHNPLRILGWAAVSTRAQAEDVKSSIPNQVSFIDTWCTDNGHILVDTLVVPGHSRNYIDFHDLNKAALKKGIDAFDKLLKHIKARDFDVFLVRDSDRLARTMPLLSFIVYSIIETASSPTHARPLAGNGRLDILAVQSFNENN